MDSYVEDLGSKWEWRSLEIGVRIHRRVKAEVTDRLVDVQGQVDARKGAQSQVERPRNERGINAGRIELAHAVVMSQS